MPWLVPPRGPWPNKVVVLGEAPGRDEEGYGKCFVGSSGQELMLMLQESDLDPATLYFTNVFKLRPPGNKVEAFFRTKKAPDAGPAWNGKHLDLGLYSHLTLLEQELALVKPELILALGKTALWFTTGLDKISKFRGVFHQSKYGMVLPTYHPAYVLRQFSDRTVVIADFLKAKRFLEDGQSPKNDHKLHINPTVEDLPNWVNAIRVVPANGVDIETAGGLIRSVGFSVSDTEAYVFPFFDRSGPNGLTNFWPTVEAEASCWAAVIQCLASPSIKIFQNPLYDCQYFYDMGIPVCGPIRDTMACHHALQPGMEKSLGFLGSIYLNSEAWKEMRSRGDREDKVDA